LELGGKAPVIIFADADLETTLPAVVGAIYGLQGQNCMAATRIYVESKIFDRVVAEAASLADKMKLGHGMDADSQLGPIISERHRDRVMSLIESGLSEGAELVTGGRAVEGPGCFVTPAVFANAQPNMRIMRDEIFGPVGCFQRFADGDLDGVAAAANDTEYGLAASVWTTNLSKAHRMARMVRVGQMSINCHGATGVNIPFGGFKQSGWGREFAKDGLDLYLETKSVTARF
jgi:phenylacetaldehyde dehydrogenase